ncbi:MAG: ATPase [Deltaproteobacteria bacterium RIFCSPLOWO2_12_FULL_50_11]|nr:MAG: ATPase [Deltaproteobacteria bacterium RIFCSPLOWO2_12_FULL_50_11]
MYSRLFNLPENKSFFLFGPRGTGKTTWVQATFPSGIYLDLLEAGLFNDLITHPQRLENLIPKDFRDWVILDEIQRVPELLNEVHRLIEKYKYKFILTGSSARKLKKQGPNLLAGRALTRFFHPLTVKELGDDFSLEHSLKFGLLPSVSIESQPKGYLESYVKTYLQEEIQQEGLTRNLGAFSRFLEAASFSQGSILNISSVARDCAVERKVVENYFTILEDLLIAYRIPIFSKKSRRRMIVHPKFYFFDVGVFKTLRPMGPLDMPEEAQGAALETLLFQELLALNDYLHLGYKIYYWRTASDIEVDFILYGERGIKAFEIKRTAKVQDSMLKGLKAFRNDYPPTRCYFIYGGEKRMWMDDIEIIPVHEFLKILPDIL